MGIKSLVKKTAAKAGNKIADLAVLSPSQLNEIQEKREKYLSEMPSADDSAAEELTLRLLSAVGIDIYNEYLNHINPLYVPIQNNIEYDERNFSVAHNVRCIKITKWVTDKNENSLEKLINVYEVLSNEKCNIALIFHRSVDGTDVYLAVSNTANANDNVDADNFRQRISDAIKGNFPGSEFEAIVNDGVPCLNNNIPYSVAFASNIPGEKSEKFISQTIEKLLDGIIPDSKQKEYTVILMATPIADVQDRKLHLAELFSALAPYAGWQTNFTYTETEGTNSTATFGVNAGVSAGIQQGQNSSITNTEGVTNSQSKSSGTTEGESFTESQSHTESQSQGNTETESESSTDSVSHSDTISNTEGTTKAHTNGSNKSTTGSVNVGLSIKIFGKGVDVGSSLATSIGNFVSDSVSETFSKTFGQTDTVSHSSTKGKSYSKSLVNTAADTIGKAKTSSIAKTVTDTVGKAISNSVSTAAGIYKGTNFGGNFGVNFARSSNVTATVGKNEGITQSFTNYNIKHTLEILEQQMKRYEQSSALGMWEFGAYVLSEDSNVASNVAHTYLAITQGEESNTSQTSVNLWRGDMGVEADNAQEICSYLRQIRHPVFGLNPGITDVDENINAYPSVITPTTDLSGKELAYSLNFPQKSISGLPVIECAEFGRNVIKIGEQSVNEVELGSVYHMNHSENTRVSLCADSLCSHTFITGSTGTGKSNTIYKIIDEARDFGATFLVIEPTKGEYKHIFGNDKDVNVYGTNPYLTPLLRINPFSFPKQVHIFEHLDRLVEIFNVCWPMYAAMPAVLKSAIEKSYSDCGWDLIKSINKYDEEIYPTFSDVARNIKAIIESSEYDAENKGAYKGSLLTRLESLTNGINGMIFSVDEIAPEMLFDENVIIDLSRVGSSETKSLIMGMLVLKLQEHRMSDTFEMNCGLKHLTVLEEAHNILKRTSFEQSSESANLIGKSVEMISNAIAEMRTYGEGFIIADQAPGLLDMSAIRNTNTKIIMRLPDYSDRELVGRAANLNDDQITELAKLPCGVAAIYQNEWIQPVLCKVDKFASGGKKYGYTPDEDIFNDLNTKDASESLLDFVMNSGSLRKYNKIYIQKLRYLIAESNLDSVVKSDFMNYISSDGKTKIDLLRRLTYDFLNAGDAMEASRHCTEITEWAHWVADHLSPSIENYSKKQINLALALLLYEQTTRDATYNNLLCRFTEVYKREGGVF